MPPAKNPVETPEELEQWRKEMDAVAERHAKWLGEKIQEANEKGVPLHKIIPVN